MSEIDWIMSYGGPLICLERSLKKSWGGIERLSYKKDRLVDNDYERACRCNGLLESIPLENGNALVIGDHPLNTSFWRSADNVLHIVRVRWAEPSADFDRLLSTANISVLSSVETDVLIKFNGMSIVLFDSVEDGRDDDISQRYTFAGGSYAISTKLFEPDDCTSLYVHEFKSA